MNTTASEIDTAGQSRVRVARDAHGPERLQRVRRRAAVAIGSAGVLNLVSALTPPLRERLHVLRQAVPLAVPEGAAVIVALSGLGLLLLGRGVRRGQQRAWRIALVLLVGSAASHLVKGVDVEEVTVALAVAGYLVVRRRAFKAPSEPGSARAAVLVAAAVAGLATVVGTAVTELVRGRRPPLPLGQAVAATLQRMAGLPAARLPHRLDAFLSPTLAAVGFGIVALVGWQAFRPVLSRARGADRHDGGLARARAVVGCHGADTLAFFALRDDKEWFFFGDTVVAYAVYGGVCLVSPDPIGPVSERTAAWDAFRRFAGDHGWSLAVLGATEDWLAVYRAGGLHPFYVGDEAIVDCQRFTLEGSRMKSLRQAYNRVARYGYRIAFHDPARLPAPLRASLLELARESRRGEAERGFSMTLGRLFHPDDTGLVLAVVSSSEGEPVAFCQFVPAPGIGGYSLDVMRRSTGQHPNGLLDFALVETIGHLAAEGCSGLALNFATMRAVLTGEMSGSVGTWVERFLLQRMSNSMQIESLLHFNSKYDPDWRPRYAVYDSPEHLLPAALAVARAESFYELPLVGRILVPKAGAAA
jgi:lysylphosphatidylglycerol synthetase-like protein (DUF2156 family)